MRTTAIIALAIFGGSVSLSHSTLPARSQTPLQLCQSIVDPEHRANCLNSIKDPAKPNDFGHASELRISRDLYEQCNRGVNYGRGGHAAVLGPGGVGAAALYMPDGLYGISQDKVCVAFMMTAYRWAQQNPAKVGQLISPRNISGVPTDPDGIGMYLGGDYVADAPFKEWFTKCPNVISARDAAIATIQEHLARDSPSMAVRSWYVIPPGSPKFPSPPIKIETIPFGPGCETSNTSVTAMQERGASCRASIARRNEAVAAQARKIAAESQSQCLPSQELTR
jgi:hypothetical protein